MYLSISQSITHPGSLRVPTLRMTSIIFRKWHLQSCSVDLKLLQAVLLTEEDNAGERMTIFLTSSRPYLLVISYPYKR